MLWEHTDWSWSQLGITLVGLQSVPRAFLGKVISNLKLKQNWSWLWRDFLVFFKYYSWKKKKHLQHSKCEQQHGRIRGMKWIQLSQGVEYHSGRAVRNVTGKIRRGHTRQGLLEAPISRANFILRAVGPVHGRVWSKGCTRWDLPISEQCQGQLGDWWFRKPEDCSRGC